MAKKTKKKKTTLDTEGGLRATINELERENKNLKEFAEALSKNNNALYRQNQLMKKMMKPFLEQAEREMKEAGEHE